MTFSSPTVTEITRDCPATLIPGGQTMLLHQGDQVVITQSLGGTFTVQTDGGYLVRINAADADALGYEPSTDSSIDPVGDPTATGADEAVAGDGSTGGGGRPHTTFDMQRVMAQLRTIFDPEIPVNVVDLGLVYSCEAHPLANGTYRIQIEMSMTAPGCGMGDVLRDDALARVRTVPGVSEVDVELVWDPPWDMSRMSEAAQLELGMY